MGGGGGPPPTLSFFGGLAGPLLLRNLRAGPARLGEADGDRLLPALHLAPGAAALERAALALVHRALDLLPGFLPVLSNAYPPYQRPLACLFYADPTNRRTYDPSLIILPASMSHVMLPIARRVWSRRVPANSMKRCASAKLLASPSDTRIAPALLPPRLVTRSRKRVRFMFCGSSASAARTSSSVIPSAVSPAPGLQKQPVRSEIPCSPAISSTRR